MGGTPPKLKTLACILFYFSFSTTFFFLQPFFTASCISTHRGVVCEYEMHLRLCLMHLKQAHIHLQKGFSRADHSLSSNASRVHKHHTCAFVWFAQEITLTKCCIMICIVLDVFNFLFFSGFTWKKPQQLIMCCLVIPVGYGLGRAGFLSYWWTTTAGQILLPDS